MRWTVSIAATLILAVGAGCLLRWWQDTPAAVDVSRRAPTASVQEHRVTLEPGDHCNRLVTQFARTQPDPMLPPAPTARTHVWPGFRGPDRNAIVPASPPLADAWPPAGPPVLWTAEVGDGHAGPAVYDACVYLLDYDAVAKADALRCLSLHDGSEVWRRSYPVLTKRNHGMSRTVPAVADCRAVGPQCHVMCVDRLPVTCAGDSIWR